MLKVKVISLPYIFQVLYVLCFIRQRYQVSVYRTIGPVVFENILKFSVTVIYNIVPRYIRYVYPEKKYWCFDYVFISYAKYVGTILSRQTRNC